MFKIVLWDYTGESSQWAKTFLKDGVEIIRTLRPDDSDQANVIMRGDWNFVLIFEQGQRELFNEIFKTMQQMKVSTENIIFAKEFQSWLSHPAAVHALLKPETCDNLYRHLNFLNHRRWHKYISASAEGLNYLATSADDFVIKTTYMGHNHTANELKLFHTLAKKYYGIDDDAGYFLELGANIGTAGIYFCKKLAPNLNWLAFEPDLENFKLLRINTILNDLEDRATLVNFGLGDKFDKVTMYRNPNNPGGNSLFQSPRNQLPETIQLIPLDAFFAENKISASTVKYIWIDTEGFEPQILLGAKNLLRENPAPIFMECNLRHWDRSGCFEDMMALLSEKYSHFIYIQGGDKVYPLDALRTIERPNNPNGQIGDIFLIRR